MHSTNYDPLDRLDGWILWILIVFFCGNIAFIEFSLIYIGILEMWDFKFIIWTIKDESNGFI